MDNVIKNNVANYKELLKNYIETQDEKHLYEAEKISKSFIKNNILPEEIVNLHHQALLELYPDLDLNIEFRHCISFLLETMISYGFAYKEYKALREEQQKLKAEIAVAASMQETLLASKKPETSDLDIGVISIPAEQMNGDYYNFVKGNDGSLGIALADVIGKGVPAALCMSMIKYAMDSFSEELMNPKETLETLNRVVERNIDSSMFITMFYAQYLPLKGLLKFSSAGHEPGFHYDAEQNTFKEIKTKGLVLGVLPNTVYQQYELFLNIDDMVVMLTDGVTECRKGDCFIEREEVLNVIKQYVYLPAQELVNQVYKHFAQLQDFHLRDDFTLIILRKEV